MRKRVRTLALSPTVVHGPTARALLHPLDLPFAGDRTAAGEGAVAILVAPVGRRLQRVQLEAIFVCLSVPIFPSSRASVRHLLLPVLCRIEDTFIFSIP
jgi:hypothetical protein